MFPLVRLIVGLFRALSDLNNKRRDSFNKVCQLRGEASLRPSAISALRRAFQRRDRRGPHEPQRSTILCCEMPRLTQFARMLLVEWRKLKLPFSGETIVVAVSGGADSTALLLAIEELKSQQKLYTDICVAHLDHRLRKSSVRDAKWVSELAARLGFRSVIGRGKVAEDARANSDNLEQAAREARYRFLERTAKRVSANNVLTGHTMDDQAETVLLRLMRGSGGYGLGGLEAMGPPPKTSSIKMVRPPLWARRI